jgi:hypothetical protein
MTSVVNRLRQHLSEQVMAKKELEHLDRVRNDAKPVMTTPERRKTKESVVVEVSKSEDETLQLKDDKTLH